ncbi:MAG: hypothetical protein AAFN74_15210, partial [Myxococcota bacterium]
LASLQQMTPFGRRTHHAFLAGALSLCACGDDDETQMTTAELDCRATALAADSIIVNGVGAADGPTDWPGLPPGAVVASTFLQLRASEAGQSAFESLSGPVTEALMASPGLLGVSIRFSESCGNTRTLTAWASEGEMFGFVASTAHTEAIRRVNEVSRGGSITDAWAADSFSAVSWENVVPRFADHDGPIY